MADDIYPSSRGALATRRSSSAASAAQKNPLSAHGAWLDCFAPTGARNDGPKKSAFTLLEMAVVVVIIGLIAGGILSAKTLIRQSNIRAVLSEYDRHTKSIKEFQDKYLALPGDFSGAQAIWGTAAACPPAYTTSLSASVATCNGGGDGKVASCSGAMSCAGASDEEIWLAWQHLAAAGLTDGRFTGAPGDGSYDHRALIGVNVPASARKPAGWSFLYYLNPSTGAYLTGDHYGHVFLLGGDKGAYDGKYTTAPVFYVTEALEMDQKIDDGLPRSGILRAWENYWLSTSDSATSATADTSYCIDTANAIYEARTDKRANVCSLIFIPGL